MFRDWPQLLDNKLVIAQMKESFLVGTEPSRHQEPIRTNSTPKFHFHPRPCVLFYCPKMKCCHCKDSIVIHQFIFKGPSLTSRALLWTYWLSMQDFSVCLFFGFGWFPNVTAQYCQKMAKLGSPPETWSMHFSLSPSWIHITLLSFIEVFPGFVYFT